MMARQRSYRNDSITYRDIALFSLLAFAATWFLIPKAERAMQSPQERAAIENSVYYPGCNEVRARGKAPLYAGQHGYREGMDGDGDGIACEPYY